jgi:hypothetical protein
MDNDFDEMCRFLCKRVPAALLLWLLRLTDDELGFVGWLDTQNLPYPGHPERRCDTVAHCLSRREFGRPWAILNEFQTIPDFDMPLRIGSYLCALGQTLRPTNLPGDRFALAAVLVHLTGTPRPVHQSEWPALESAFTIKPRVVNLAELSALDILAEVAAGQAPFEVLGWVPLMVGGNLATIIEPWKQVANAAPEKLRSDLADAARLFGELTQCRPLWVSGLKEWSKMRSQQANEWRQEGRKEGYDLAEKKGIINAYTLLRSNGLTETVARQQLATLYGPQSDIAITEWQAQAPKSASS